MDIYNMYMKYIYIYIYIYISIRTCVPNLGAGRRERFFNNIYPPKPPWGGVGQLVFKVRVSIRTCVPNLGAVRRESRCRADVR